MALINCKECNSQISSAADACPNCGAPNKKTSNIGCMSFFVWCLVILLVIAAIKSSLQPPQTTQSSTAPPTTVKTQADYIDDAKFVCIEFIKKSLHDPDSAKFDSRSGFAAQEKPAGTYTVDVTYSAKNGFNATRKAITQCKVRLATGEWRLISLETL